MTTYARVEYVCSTIALDDGTFQYSIRATVTDKGELPYSAIFVYQLSDIADPTQDVFVRVATPYDLENIYIGRQSALDAGTTYYLLSELVRKYNDLNTAVQAKEAVKSRINDGVRAWYDFDSDFSGTLDQAHPTSDATYEVQLQDAYYAARTARVATEAALVTADTALSTARALAAAQAAVTAAYKKQLDYITQALAYWGAFKSAVGTVNGSSGFAYWVKAYQVYMKHMLEHIDPDDPMISAFSAQIDTQDLKILEQSNNEASIGQLDTVLNTDYAELTTLYNTALAETVIKNNAMAAAVIAKKEAEAAVTSALITEDVALAAALSICPDFTPVPI
jgi:hypothetical protein